MSFSRKQTQIICTLRDKEKQRYTICQTFAIISSARSVRL